MIRFHHNDLPAEASFGEAAAIDTETLGLVVGRDRLCVVQISRGDGSADIVRIAAGQTSAPNLERLLADAAIVKLFHYGRFDMAVLHHAFGVMAAPIYCTKIASKIARTYTDRHGLKDLTRELMNVEISKQQQSSDWGADTLSEAQLAYAASDVLHLHALREKLDAMLKREGRDGLARAAFAYLPDRVRLDLPAQIFKHHRHGQNRPHRIRNPFSRDIRRRPVHRLEQRNLPGMNIPGRRQSQPTRQLRAQVAGNIPKQVRRHDHLKLRRVPHHLHQQIVDVLV